MGRAVAVLAAVLTLVLASAGLIVQATPASAAQTIGYPVFTGPGLPAEPASYNAASSMMQAMYDAEASGTDFWMDRLLARTGSDPAGNQWLMTRGRTALMRGHTPSVIGFGGDFAYYDPTFDRFDNGDGYVVTIANSTFTETVSQRRQTPSHWRSVHTNSSLRLSATVTKFITHNNVAVANIAITNTGTASRTFPLAVSSPFAWRADGSELTGVLDVQNSRGERLTTIFPRLSGTGLAPTSDGRLSRSVTLAAGASTTVKVQLGLISDEIAQSATEYASYRAATPANAFATHVRAYNKWWADNVPYFDVPDGPMKKFIYYRWWLMRFNYLDADIPGNDFQFPTSIEGVLGYNNAIALTVPMFIDDLKYLRDPVYSYGPWVSTGESSSGGRFRDNPGDPENWSNSYTQYIAEAAWRSYQIHGGPLPIVENLAKYAEGDVKGQLDTYDTNDNWLIEYDWGAMTGNDADAVSFHWREGNLDRAEAAYQYSGALAAAQAYETLGNTAKATEMRGIAQNIANAFIGVLWNPSRQLFEHKHVATNAHVPWKEINNYYPFSVGAIPNQQPYTNALRLFSDPAEYPVFPFYTANQKDKQAAANAGFPGSNNFSQINSTVQFRLFSSVLRNYAGSTAITAEDYKKLLYWNAWATYIGGNTAWPDSNEFWANWNPNTSTIDYRSWIHHTTLGSSIWTFVEDAGGLRPRNDDKIELSPIDIGWDHFTVNNLRYRDADLTIVWDKPGGTRYYPSSPEGYSAYLNGQRVFTVDSLTHLVWDPATGQVAFPDGAGANLKSPKAVKDVSAPQDVEAVSPRLVDLFAKAGADIGTANPPANLATGSTPSASFTANGSTVAGAVDGWTIDRPNWSSAGSPNAQDWYAVNFGKQITLDDVRLYFYRDRTATGLAEPETYLVQYYANGAWTTVPGQARDPAIPRANYNRVRFPQVTTDRIRVLMTHQDGHRTGLKEVEVFRSGSPPTTVNAAPYVLARQDTSYQRPSQVRLQGTVKDDALPATGTLTSAWSAVSGPGTVIFGDTGSAQTIATFTEAGTYRLRLTADDGEKTSSSTVDVTVAAAGNQINTALFATPSASYTSSWENVEAINDGVDPPSSNDSQNPRWGTWPETGTQWVQYDWANPVRVNKAEVYFFDDGGGVRVPASWKLQYWNGTAFADVPGASGYPVAVNAYNSVTFPSVTTTRMRAVLQSGAGSVGVLEWKLHAEPPTSLRAVHTPTLANTVPELPDTVTAIYADGGRMETPVVWEPIAAGDVDSPGSTVTVQGIAEGTRLVAKATVYVRATNAVLITALEPEQITTVAGRAPQLPSTVLATFNDGSRDNVGTTVTWDAIDPARYATPGTFTVGGTVPGTSIRAQATVTVTAG